MTIAYDAPRRLPRTKPLYLPRIKPYHILFLLLIVCGVLVINPIKREFQIWHEDSIALDIIRNHSHSLKFEVAGHKYQIVTPAIQLTDEMRIAWFNHAGRSGYPLYAADGPLAIDP